LPIISYKTKIPLVDGKIKDKSSSFDATGHMDKTCSGSDPILGEQMIEGTEWYGKGKKCCHTQCI
jgi:hypothetical protein